MNTLQATYSPEDNKLRLYSVTRLDAGTYQLIKEAGFRWAPKQDVFVAPMWTPHREDVLMKLCGDIGDEDSTLAQRAEERAERFEDYREKRSDEAQQHEESCSAIGERFAGGQPILVGHHSEWKARKDQEKMDRHMQKTIRLWETASYWKSRAAGALRHAKYKELPRVRARRIKKLEAEQRKHERSRSQANNTHTSYLDPEFEKITLKNGDNLLRRLLECGWDAGLSFDDSHLVRSGELSVEDARAKAINNLAGCIAHDTRWIDHLNNRITYEKALLEDQGRSELLDKPKRPKPLPLCNYRQEVIIIENRYHKGEMVAYPQVEMTKAEYASIHHDYKATRPVDHSHRVRTAMQKRSLVSVFLTDSKVHPKPEPIQVDPVPPTPRIPRVAFEDIPEAIQRAQALKDQLHAPKTIIVGDQLFPTPRDIAQKMVALADIQAGHSVLEPSAGTGALLKVLPCLRPQGGVTAVEILHAAHAHLSRWADNLIHGDFLACNGNLGLFDRIVMNPPFKNGADIQHIQHAMTFLNPGGKLVALCANGPRQHAQLKPLSEAWEELPEGTF